jgi:hypothetical protein
MQGIELGFANRRNLLAVFAGNDAIAVELELVQPAGPGRWPVGERAGKEG